MFYRYYLFTPYLHLIVKDTKVKGTHSLLLAIIPLRATIYICYHIDSSLPNVFNGYYYKFIFMSFKKGKI